MYMHTECSDGKILSEYLESFKFQINIKIFNSINKYSPVIFSC
jgi:hypothetical protein